MSHGFEQYKPETKCTEIQGKIPKMMGAGGPKKW